MNDLMRIIDEMALRYKCSYCMALPGIWCHTKNNYTSSYLHADRTHPLQVVWANGYNEGFADYEYYHRRPSTTGTTSVGTVSFNQEATA